MAGEGRSAEPAKDIFQLLEEQAGPPEEGGASQEAEVIFVGSKGGGKSSLILAFVNKPDVPKPTTALEHKFARYSSKEGGSSTVANIWELAGDTQLAQLLDVVLSPAKLARSQVVIVADLSKPGDALRTVTYWLDAVRARVEACAHELRQSEAGRAALGALEAKLPAPSAEVRPVGVPVTVVGSKCDVFEKECDASTEFPQVMAKTLRFTAHVNGASLVYTRDKDKALLGAMKRAISQHAFGQEPPTSTQLEYTKPIVVPAGRDSLRQIGHPPGLEGVTDRARLDEAWARTFQALFPPSAESQRASGRERKRHVVDSDAYGEEAIDGLRAQKLKELSTRAARARAEAAAEASAAAARGAGRAPGGLTALR